MELFNEENLIYLISNLFRIYIIFRFLNIFFDRRSINKKLEGVAFCIYFLINSIVYLCYESPFINLIINIMLFLSITFIYHGKFSKRLIATVLIYAINIFCEGISYVVLGFINVTDINNSTVVTSNLLMLLSVLILEKKINLNNSYNISFAHWIALFMIPISSIFIAIFIILSEINIFTVISIASLLFINILVFYLYDILNKSYEEKYEKKLLKQQNNAYINQFQIMKQAQDNIEMFRHDVKNHISALQNISKNDEKQDVFNYLKNMSDFVKVAEEYVKSGNEGVDSILNYKINEIKKFNVKIEIDIRLPRILNISLFDLNIILGNLLDNATEALKVDIGKNKKFKIVIELERGVVYISISNSYIGKVVLSEEKLQTRHIDKSNHGIGLNSVKNIVEKYNGTISINYSDEEFMVDILLYNNQIN